MNNGVMPLLLDLNGSYRNRKFTQKECLNNVNKSPFPPSFDILLQSNLSKVTTQKKTKIGFKDRR